MLAQIFKANPLTWIYIHTHLNKVHSLFYNSNMSPRNCGELIYILSSEEWRISIQQNISKASNGPHHCW